MTARRPLALVAGIALVAVIALPVAARNINAQNAYTVHNLVSDQAGVAAVQDPNLVNGWGITAGPTTPWWVSDEGTDKSTLYNGNTGAIVPLVVSVPGGPTGTVFNGVGTDFVVTNGTVTNGARFIFATESGQVLGWTGGFTTAVLGADGTGHDAVYLGLAIASSGGAQYLYAADFHNAHIDVYDRTFTWQDWGDAFTDPNLPEGYAPFGIQAITMDGVTSIFIAYALQDEDGEEEVAGEGLGVVDQFGTDGSFWGRVATGGELNAPWGIALAPNTETASFGKFSGDLLVGNFGDGRISAYRLGEDGWEAHGLLKGTDHTPLEIDGLWGIGFGNGAASGSRSVLYFAAGPEEETHGLFGSVAWTP